ncbi:MAG TPA: ABC transporter permease [Candidatus Limnocylindrales bacterium]|nr:ABC transporter permease [Candidatus Limnocylindrales bacterium]
MFSKILNSFITILLALLVGMIPLILTGNNPVKAYIALFQGAFGSLYGLTETLVKAIPLILTGLAVSFPLRAGFWNIGAEGQLYLGAMAATGVALTFGHLASFILLPLVILSGFLAGALWGLVPAFLKVRLQVNEILLTLMMNYVAVNGSNYLVYGPLKDPQGANFPITATFSEAAWLPRLPGTRLHAGIILAFTMAGVLYLILGKTRLGYEIKVVGANPQVALYGGISLMTITLIVMMIGGGLAGLAGVGEVAGLQHRLRKDISPGYGYTAIPIALLGKGHPIGVTIAALLFGALFVGGSHMQQTTKVPVALISIIQALVVLFVVAGEALRSSSFGVRNPLQKITNP